jgi:hypothetical protein
MERLVRFNLPSGREHYCLMVAPYIHAVPEALQKDIEATAKRLESLYRRRNRLRNRIPMVLPPPGVSFTIIEDEDEDDAHQVEVKQWTDNKVVGEVAHYTRFLLRGPIVFTLNEDREVVSFDWTGVAFRWVEQRGGYLCSSYLCRDSHDFTITY